LLSISVNKTYPEFIDHLDQQMHRQLTSEADWEALVVEAKQSSWFTSFAGQSSSLLLINELILFSQATNFVPSDRHMLFSVCFLPI